MVKSVNEAGPGSRDGRDQETSFDGAMDDSEGPALFSWSSLDATRIGLSSQQPCALDPAEARREWD